MAKRISRDPIPTHVILAPGCRRQFPRIGRDLQQCGHRALDRSNELRGCYAAPEALRLEVDNGVEQFLAAGGQIEKVA